MGDVDKSQKPYTKWKEPGTKYYTMYDSPNMILQKRRNSRDRNQICDFQGPEVAGRNWSQRGMSDLFGVMKLFYILIVVVVTGLRTFADIHRPATPQKGEFPVYKLCLNKRDVKKKKRCRIMQTSGESQRQGFPTNAEWQMKEWPLLTSHALPDLRGTVKKKEDKGASRGQTLFSTPF